MDRNAFHTLVLLTKDIGGLTDSKSMSSSEKLAMFLNILAHHEKNRSIKVDYIKSGWSVSQAFNKCLSAILKLTPLLLVNPKPVLEDAIEDRWKWFEVGSAADGRVLRDAIVRRNGNYGGYTNGKGFLSLYQGYSYWLKDWRGDNPSPRCKEELFNMRHDRARNVIERAFGLVKGRWGILKSSSWYSVKVHNRIISACCLIHNFIRREMEVDPLDIDIEEQMEYQHENIDVVESSEEWTTWRDELAQSMWNARFNN
ncbi:uncharacterized protein LOC125869619 [Solanum stenotomum]|uniref:uncharacterized protein LOC125869619 n=1 Tax=Solanum stenotomum TaxID=172797 RepID=UPI0020D1D514|nr:uncharacterized protein LOC125869619 [Solanum stenotomum]